MAETRGQGKKKEVRRPLKPRDIKFLKAKAANPDIPDYKAAMVATGATSQKVGSVQAVRMLENVSLREAIDAEMAKQGITMEHVIKPVEQALHDDSLDMRLRGHDRAMKMLAIAHGEDNKSGGNTFVFNNGSSTNNFMKK